MDWIGEIFKLVGGSQENIEQSRALADADRGRGGKIDENQKTDLYIFGGLIIVLIAVLFIFRKKA